jgi:hypothetical protein
MAMLQVYTMMSSALENLFSQRQLKLANSEHEEIGEQTVYDWVTLTNSECHNYIVKFKRNNLSSWNPTCMESCQSINGAFTIETPSSAY